MHVHSMQYNYVIKTIHLKSLTIQQYCKKYSAQASLIFYDVMKYYIINLPQSMWMYTASRGTAWQWFYSPTESIKVIDLHPLLHVHILHDFLNTLVF